MRAVSAIFGLRVRVVALLARLAPLALVACAGVLASACDDRIPRQPEAPVVAAPAVETRFLESAEAAGLVYIQHRARMSGDCLFDNLSRPTAAASVTPSA